MFYSVHPNLNKFIDVLLNVQWDTYTKTRNTEEITQRPKKIK